MNSSPLVTVYNTAWIEIIVVGDSEGVLMAIDLQLPHVKLDSPNDLEALTVKISCDHPIINCVVYVLPNSCSATYHSLLTYICIVFLFIFSPCVCCW